MAQIQTITIKVKVELSLWSAIKIRLAGFKNIRGGEVQVDQMVDFNDEAIH